MTQRIDLSRCARPLFLAIRGSLTPPPPALQVPGLNHTQDDDGSDS